VSEGYVLETGTNFEARVTSWPKTFYSPESNGASRDAAPRKALRRNLPAFLSAPAATSATAAPASYREGAPRPDQRNRMSPHRDQAPSFAAQQLSPPFTHKQPAGAPTTLPQARCPHSHYITSGSEPDNAPGVSCTPVQALLLQFRLNLSLRGYFSTTCVTTSRPRYTAHPLSRLTVCVMAGCRRAATFQIHDRDTKLTPAYR